MTVNPNVFIIGCPRSGTTLLQCIVDAHPAIAIAFETHRITRWFDTLVVPAPDGLISTIALYRDWSIGTFALESMEMTQLDLRLDYPKPEVLTEMPLNKEMVS